MKLNNISEAIARVRYVRISPIKARRVAGQLRCRSCNEAVVILSFLPHKSSGIILTALKSAISNYRQCFGSEKTDLVIKDIRVDAAPFLKRICPHAQGRAFPIKKHFSHITSSILISNCYRFLFIFI